MLITMLSKNLIGFFLLLIAFNVVAEWEKDRSCLQRLICNAKGELLRDYKENRVCIGKFLLAQENLETLESDPPPMCLLGDGSQNLPIGHITTNQPPANLRNDNPQEEVLKFEIFLPGDIPDLGEPGDPNNIIILQRHQNKKFEIIPQKNVK